MLKQPMITNKVIDFYLKLDLKIIPVQPLSKIPIGYDWQNLPNYNLNKCRRIFATSNCNVGLLLGDIVDVEGDTDEANYFLNKLIDDYPHPKYQSAKSIHHLFTNPDPNLTRLIVNGIEFRGHSHHSVIPPSRHSDGIEYSWIKGTKFPVPPMPQSLLKFYNSQKKVKLVKNEYVSVLCDSCRSVVQIHRKRFCLEVKACENMKINWSCKKCRTCDLRPHVRHLKKHIKN